jgi:uncharacterized protein (TIGR00156 family)
MQNRLLIAGAAAVGLIGMAAGTLIGIAAAQDRSAAARTTWTVQQVMQEARDDDRVTVRGRVVRKIGDEDFILADETGEIRIDGDDGNTRQLEVGQQVEVRGEVDRDPGEEVDIEADDIKPL